MDVTELALEGAFQPRRGTSNCTTHCVFLVSASGELGRDIGLATPNSPLLLRGITASRQHWYALCWYARTSAHSATQMHCTAMDRTKGIGTPAAEKARPCVMAMKARESAVYGSVFCAVWRADTTARESQGNIDTAYLLFSPMRTAACSRESYASH